MHIFLSQLLEVSRDEVKSETPERDVYIRFRMYCSLNIIDHLQYIVATALFPAPADTYLIYHGSLQLCAGRGVFSLKYCRCPNVADDLVEAD
jgi:hypothetical protein